MSVNATEAPAATLHRAAEKLRDLATRSAATLARHELEWTDLTVSDKAYRATASPMVWSQYAAATGPVVGAAVADWLDSAARDAVEIGPDPDALATARSILGEASGV